MHPKHDLVISKAIYVLLHALAAVVFAPEDFLPLSLWTQVAK